MILEHSGKKFWPAVAESGYVANASSGMVSPINAIRTYAGNKFWPALRKVVA